MAVVGDILSCDIEVNNYRILIFRVYCKLSYRCSVRRTKILQYGILIISVESHEGGW